MKSVGSFIWVTQFGLIGGRGPTALLVTRPVLLLGSSTHMCDLEDHCISIREGKEDAVPMALTSFSTVKFFLLLKAHREALYVAEINSQQERFQ